MPTPLYYGPYIRNLRCERSNVILNNLLNLVLQFRSDVATGDLLKESRLAGGQVRAELLLPDSDLVNGDRIQLNRAKNF
jgi:hypothetical protein